MNCLVTAGPTYEPLDRVRRLTNFSTGGLGCRLAAHLTAAGHTVVLLVGEQATWPGSRTASTVEVFSTTDDLAARLQRHAAQGIDGVFHAAAVSDFAVGEVREERTDGPSSPVSAGKLPTSAGSYLVRLVPTRKLIGSFRSWFPRARLVGWKFEVDGDRTDVLAKAVQQLATNRTDACVANGPAYGPGFGLVTPPDSHEPLANEAALFHALDRFLVRPPA